MRHARNSVAFPCRRNDTSRVHRPHRQSQWRRRMVVASKGSAPDRAASTPAPSGLPVQSSDPSPTHRRQAAWKAASDTQTTDQFTATFSARNGSMRSARLAAHPPM